MLTLAGGQCSLTHNHATEQTARNMKNEVLRNHIVWQLYIHLHQSVHPLPLAGHQRWQRSCRSGSTWLLARVAATSPYVPSAHSGFVTCAQARLVHSFFFKAKPTEFFHHHTATFTSWRHSFWILCHHSPLGPQGPWHFPLYIQLQPPVPKAVTSPPACCHPTEAPSPCWVHEGDYVLFLMTKGVFQVVYVSCCWVNSS